MRTQITSEKCGECHGPYALGVKMGNTIFTTQIGTDVTGEMVAGGITEQTKATMENAKKQYWKQQVQPWMMLRK